jgi:hypothetical protein
MPISNLPLRINVERLEQNCIAMADSAKTMVTVARKIQNEAIQMREALLPKKKPASQH